MIRIFGNLSIVIILFYSFESAMGEIQIFSTGVDASGAVLPDNSQDPHYTVNVAGGAQGIVDSSLSASPPADSVSAWIRPYNYFGPGSYPTETTFVADSEGPITITGRWAAYLAGLSISLNGVSSGDFPTPTPGNADWTPFSITGTTTVGVNTLFFNPYSDGNPPVGVRIEIISVEVPEPGSAWLGCVAGLLLIQKRRRARDF